CEAIVRRQRQGTVVRRLAAVVGVGVVTLVGAAGAFAGGGANLASAPTISPGQQQFGNTTDGCEGNCEGADFWKLSLIAADRVTVDWESSAGNYGCGTEAYAAKLEVWPVGTTDFSINNLQPSQTFYIGDNDKAESTFTANGTGVFPLVFKAQCFNEGPPPLGG